MRYGCNHVYVLMCSSLSRGEVSTHAFLNVNAVFHGRIKDHIVHCTAHGEFHTQRFAGKALSSTLVFGFATGPGTLRIVEIQNIIITKYMHCRRFIWAESCTIWFFKSRLSFSKYRCHAWNLTALSSKPWKAQIPKILFRFDRNDPDIREIVFLSTLSRKH